MNLPNLRILRQFNFLFGFSLFSPLAVIYYAQVSGSYTLGTSIFGLITLSTAVFEVPTGVLSDRIGRKQIIIFGSITRVIAYMAYALGFSYLWLVIGALFEGLAHALFSGNNDAFLYDT